MELQLSGAVPEIPVKDVVSASTYYKERLGFTIDWGSEDLGLFGISKGNCRLFLADEQYRSGYGNTGPVLIWLNLGSSEEVDELYRIWKDQDVEIVSPPESKPWGLREFTASDLDGNFLRVFYDFATPQQQAT